MTATTITNKTSFIQPLTVDNTGKKVLITNVEGCLCANYDL